LGSAKSASCLEHSPTGVFYVRPLPAHRPMGPPLTPPTVTVCCGSGPALSGLRRTNPGPLAVPLGDPPRKFRATSRTNFPAPSMLMPCTLKSPSGPPVSSTAVPAMRSWPVLIDTPPPPLACTTESAPVAGSSNRTFPVFAWSAMLPPCAVASVDPANPVNPASSFNRLGYGILNLGPCPVAGGKVAFGSNRRG